jgi:hypothetical protein
MKSLAVAVVCLSSQLVKIVVAEDATEDAIASLFNHILRILAV